MELIILGSNSRGNSYILKGKRSALLVEAGVPSKRVLEALDFDMGMLDGCIISHSHGDHAGHVKGILDYGIKAWVSEATNSEIKIKGHRSPLLFEGGVKFHAGEFMVIPFALDHDVSNHGFLIHHPECGKVLYASDTATIPYKFNRLNQVIIEANHDTAILERNIYTGVVPMALGSRIMESHMSLDSCAGFLGDLDLSVVNNIVLIHLSDNNSDEVLFHDTITARTGKTVTVANKEVKIDFNIMPF